MTEDVLDCFIILFFILGISLLTIGIGEQTDPLILKGLAFNHDLSYSEPDWTDMPITARMEADIIAGKAREN